MNSTSAELVYDNLEFMLPKPVQNPPQQEERKPPELNIEELNIEECKWEEVPSRTPTASDRSVAEIETRDTTWNLFTKLTFGPAVKGPIGGHRVEAAKIAAKIAAEGAAEIAQKEVELAAAAKAARMQELERARNARQERLRKVREEVEAEERAKQEAAERERDESVEKMRLILEERERKEREAEEAARKNASSSWDSTAEDSKTEGRQSDEQTHTGQISTWQMGACASPSQKTRDKNFSRPPIREREPPSEDPDEKKISAWEVETYPIGDRHDTIIFVESPGKMFRFRVSGELILIEWARD
ncbi:hypothetical protein ABW20_dc0108764 [Dactylellina cionopaga]|nr:hypothetical protein ABW20_dc0108764 [Dactylellina cionopaga]